jgi:uncharacterized protein (DUF1778 family)
MTAKTDRLEMRLTPEQRELIERAAVLSGQMLASFIRSQLVERAQEIVARHSRTELSARDFRRFLSALDRDEEPVPALKAAFRRHRARRRG